MMEALSSSEASVLSRATRRNIPEDAILHSHRNENLKSYKDICNLGYRPFHPDETNQRTRAVTSVLQLLVTANVIPRSLYLFALTMVVTKVSGNHIPECGIL
jgi:hypothetical protein